MFRYVFKLLITVVAASIGAAGGIPQAAPRHVSANLVWKPYLQQVTDTSAIVLWTTQTSGNAEVRFSSDQSYSSVATGSSRLLSALNVQLHRVMLSNLRPNTIYRYKVYTNGEDLLPDDTLSFSTAPGTGSDTPFTFLAFGDFGVGRASVFRPAQERLRAQMQRDSFRLIMTTGDNAYHAGTYDNFHTNVFSIYTDIFSRAAIYPALGNHDALTSNGRPQLDLFDLPTNAWRTRDQERYYSFDYGNAHFIVLDTNGPLLVDDAAAPNDMFDWLRADLSSTAQPWKIVVFHHSAYSTGKHHSDIEVPIIRSKLVPIMQQSGVALVLTGHDHNYQRTKPLWDGQITSVAAGGIVYVVSGAGAAANYSCSSAAWLEFSICAKDYGLYSRITISGATLTIEAVGDTGEIRDSYTFSRAPRNTPTIPPPTATPPAPALQPQRWLPLIVKPTLETR